MMRRPLWLGAGVALGAGGTLWAQLRLRRLVRRLPGVLASLGPVRRGTGASIGARALPQTPAVEVAEVRDGATGPGAILSLAARRAVTRAGIGLARAAISGAAAQREGSPARR